MMNKSILITGANAGIGKETDRQLDLLNETEKVILGCRNPQKAEVAKKELEQSTGKKIFEILIMNVSDVSSEAARGIEKMKMERPDLAENSVAELASILDGTYFKDKFDPMKAYGYVKYVGTLWMSSMARKYPNIKCLSVSPGATSGTSITDNAPLPIKIIFEYVMMPIVMPLRGMVHGVDKGAARYVQAINQTSFSNGGFYASKEDKVVGELVDQFDIYPTMAIPQFQDNAYDALHKYLN